MRTIRRYVLPTLWALVLASSSPGCSGGTGSEDAGTDAGTDAGDAGDASGDAGGDAGDTGAGSDAGDTGIAGDSAARPDSSADAGDAGDADTGDSSLDAGDSSLDAGCTAELCDGVDNDCDLAVDEELTAPPCALTLGVCALAVSRCGGAAGWACDYGAGYEATEAACDGFDNDCDGVVDEGCECGATAPCGAQTETRWEDSSDIDPWALEQLAGGTLAIAGDHGTPSNALVMVARLDGSLVWANDYAATTRTHLRDVEPLFDGGMVAVGYVEGVAPSFDDVYVLRLDPAGAVLWARRVGGTSNERAFGVEVVGDAILIAGEVGANILFVELGLDGALRRAQSLDGPGTIERARDLAVGAAGPVLYGEVYGTSGFEPFLFELDTRRTMRIRSHDVATHRVRATADGGFLFSGRVYGYAGDSGSGFSARVDATLALTHFHAHNSTFSDLYDTVELTSGGLLSGGSNAWAIVESLRADGTGARGYVYRPLAPSGRNEVRAILPLADGGFAAAAQDGSRRLWLFRGNAAGAATSCNRDDQWWTTTDASRSTTGLSLTATALALTADPIAVTVGTVAPTVTAVCSEPAY